MRRQSHVLILAAVACGWASAQQYDLVLRGGRVIDPESGLDAVRHVGVIAGRVAAVSTSPLNGKSVIDAAGLVVAPGFIDLHAHGQDAENHRYQAMDGVTTALELEIGTGDVAAWYSAREGKRLINSGVTSGHIPARMRLMKDPSTALVPRGDAAHRPATEEEITVIKQSVERGLQQGALGVGFGIQYTPGASRWEILDVFRVAARFRAPVFVHIRHMGDAEPSAVNALEEMIAASAITGAPVHVVHLTSSGLQALPKLLQTIDEARARGMDITTECYPYTAAMTEIESAIFDPGWQKILGVDYGAIEWVATGERLNAETFAARRKSGGMVIMHMIPPKMAAQAMAHPQVMVASDGVIMNGRGHPRGAGTFSRVLGKYVREEKSLTLMEALRKMTIMPARRLESIAPMMKQKGRIREGADADITIFDPATVTDRATFEKPNLYSAGIRHVFVNGTAVVRDGALVSGVAPGRAVRAPLH